MSKFIETSWANSAATAILQTPLNLVAQGVGTNQRTGSQIRLLKWEFQGMLQIYHASLVQMWYKVLAPWRLLVAIDNNNANSQTLMNNVLGSSAADKIYGFNQDSSRYFITLNELSYFGLFNSYVWGASATPNATFGPQMPERQASVIQMSMDFPPNTITTYSGTSATVADVSTNLVSLLLYCQDADTVLSGRFRVYFEDV